MENQVLKALKERRSVRKYKAEQITDAELTAVLEAGALMQPRARACKTPG